MNFDQTQNFDNLIAENKQFMDEMRKITHQKRQEVYNQLDLMIRKHLNASNTTGMLGHKYITNMINTQKEQKTSLETQISKLEKQILQKCEDLKGDKNYNEKLISSMTSKVKSQGLFLIFLTCILLYILYHKYA